MQRHGPPTILLEAGDESGVSQWGLVAPGLLSHTRTCAYDRAGVGRSVEATGSREVDDLLGDLEALLRVADIKGPYLLVGASGGGYVMAGLAARRPADVAGLVLVETPKAITILPPEVAVEIKCGATGNVEHRDYAAVEHAVWDTRKRIGDFPMTVISNDYTGQSPVGDDVTNVPDQRGWLVLSPLEAGRGDDWARCRREPARPRDQGDPGRTPGRPGRLTLPANPTIREGRSQRRRGM